MPQNVPLCIWEWSWGDVLVVAGQSTNRHTGSQHFYRGYRIIIHVSQRCTAVDLGTYMKLLQNCLQFLPPYYPTVSENNFLVHESDKKAMMMPYWIYGVFIWDPKEIRKLILGQDTELRPFFKCTLTNFSLHKHGHILTMKGNTFTKTFLNQQVGIREKRSCFCQGQTLCVIEHPLVQPS